MKQLIFTAIFVLLASGAVLAQKPKYIGMKNAKVIAMREVPGKIKSAEREKEHGKMIYSFDVLTSDGNITEINIDAITGDVLEKQVENPADEAKEKAEDKRKKDKDD